MSKLLPIVEAKSLTLDEWLAYIETPECERKFRAADFEFPTDEHLHEFLQSIQSRNEASIKKLLRSLLINHGTLGIDEITRRSFWSLPYQEQNVLKEKSEFIRRLVLPSLLPWDGIFWVLDLLPNYPLKALGVLDAYFIAHCQFLPEGRMRGLCDAETIIRRRYLDIENPREALLSLRPNEFEYLVGALYEKLGYEVVVTKTSRDGGVDVEARRKDPAGRALVLIQCKRYKEIVRVSAVRELMGVVSKRQANKGVLVATCGFTTPAKQEAASTPMIELLDFSALNGLLNKYMGAKWPDCISYEIRNMQMASAKGTIIGDVF